MSNTLIMQNASRPFTTTCTQCGCHVQVPSLAHRERASCPRCGHQLGLFRRHAPQACAAYSLSALIALSLSLPFNFLSFRSQGQHHDIDLPAGIMTLFTHDGLTIGLITVMATLILPGMLLLSMLVVSVSQSLNLPHRNNRRFVSLVTTLAPWSMAEIFLVGMLVSLVKITSMADIVIGISFYAYALFAFFTLIAFVYYESAGVHQWLEQHHPHRRLVITQPLNPSVVIQRSWALLGTAVLLYIPANTLPIMHTQVLQMHEPSTIMGGVISLWQAGSYAVAIIIVVASVLVPIAKILILAWLTASIQLRHSTHLSAKMRYYRIVEWIGRWSMIDVFVVAILVALVQLGGSLSIHPGPAAIAFCAVVFVTMIAAMTFDVRLFWYHKENKA